MGKAHSNAYRQMPRFFDSDTVPFMKVICGRNEEDVKKAAIRSICQGYPSANVMPSTLGAFPTLMGALSLVLANKFASISIH